MQNYQGRRLRIGKIKGFTITYFKFWNISVKMPERMIARVDV